jgi:hypothetical protein
MAGCKAKSDRLPLNKMKVVMWDMFCAEEMYAKTVGTDAAAIASNKKNLQLYQQVFAANNITREVFYSNYHFYQQHPDQFRILMDSVQAYGNRVKTPPPPPPPTPVQQAPSQRMALPNKP